MNISFAWTPGQGSYKHYPPYVNLTGNVLTVRGPEKLDGEHPAAGDHVLITLPPEAIDELRAALTRPPTDEVVERPDVVKALWAIFMRIDTMPKSNKNMGLDVWTIKTLRLVRETIDLAAMPTIPPQSLGDHALPPSGLSQSVVVSSKAGCRYRKRRKSMTRFRKLPVEIEAVRFNGKGFDEGPQWLHDAIVANEIHMVRGVPCISTSEGTMIADPGDWIIRGTAGELYPCKPDIFASIYERAA